MVHDQEVFSDGFQGLSPEADLTIDDVSIVGENLESVTFLGARIGLPGRPYDFHQRMRGFPPKAVPARFQVPAHGATLDAGEHYMLILGFQVTGEVPSVREAVRIEYTADDTAYVTTMRARLVTCPSPTTDDECSRQYPHPG